MASLEVDLVSVWNLMVSSERIVCIFLDAIIALVLVDFLKGLVLSIGTIMAHARIVRVRVLDCTLVLNRSIFTLRGFGSASRSNQQGAGLSHLDVWSTSVSHHVGVMVLVSRLSQVVIVRRFKS